MLTPREKDVADLFAKGCDRAEISAGLAISTSAVDKIIRALKTKFAVTNQNELIVQCLRLTDEPLHTSMPTSGALFKQKTSSKNAAIEEIDFQVAGSFAALFQMLLTQLTAFEVTDIVCSLISCPQNQPIRDIATRWSFSDNISFDFDISPDENLAFKYARDNWAPTPLDIEAMMTSEFYGVFPDKIKAQNEVFVKAGLVRGITYVLPAISISERLVISVLFKNVKVERFHQIVAQYQHEIYCVLIAFRHAHVQLAAPSVKLSVRERELMCLIAKDASLTQAATSMGLSRRAVDRMIADIRQAFGTKTNTGAVAAFIRDMDTPRLPF